MDQDEVSKLKYEFFEYENSPIEISDIDSIRTQNPLFFLDEDIDFFDLNFPDSGLDTPKLNEIKKENQVEQKEENNNYTTITNSTNSSDINNLGSNSVQTQNQQNIQQPPIPMFGSSFQSEKNIPFSQQQYVRNKKKKKKKFILSLLVYK